MTVTLVAAKDMKLWHIKAGGDMTLCGVKGTQMETELRDLPEDDKYMCKDCLTKQGASK